MTEELLDIVNEAGEPVGVASREQVHREGLLHREVHVWLFTPSGELIFQHRAKNKDTWPDKLDATVGGHVGLHEGFEAAALRELQEETGVTVALKEVRLIRRVHTNVFDPTTGTKNNVLREIYALRYDKPFDTLRADTNETAYFEAWPIQTVLHLPEEQAPKFIPLLLEGPYLNIYREIQRIAHG